MDTMQTVALVAVVVGAYFFGRVMGKSSKLEERGPAYRAGLSEGRVEGWTQRDRGEPLLDDRLPEHELRKLLPWL